MATKKANGTAAKAAKSTPAAKVESNMVTLTQLCDKLDITTTSARVRLRKSPFADGMGSRWEWTKGSKVLGQVEAFLKG